MQIAQTLLLSSQKMDVLDKNLNVERQADKSVLPNTQDSSNKGNTISAIADQLGFKGLSQIGIHLDGLLDTATRSSLIQLQANGSSTWKSPSRPETGVEWLSKTLLDVSKGITHPSQDTPAEPSRLTGSDLKFIKDTTGANVVITPDGGTVYLQNDGNYLNKSDEDIKNIQSLVAQIDTDRSSNRLSGNIDKAYIENLFSRANELKNPFNIDFQQEVLSVFDKTTGSQN